MPRQQKYTDQQMIDALKVTKGLVYLAADKIGCDPSTIFRRANTSELVAAAMKRERGRMVDIAEAKLWQQINDGNTTAILFFLKTQAKDRGYIERSEVVNIPADIARMLNELMTKAQAKDLDLREIMRELNNQMDAPIPVEERLN